MEKAMAPHSSTLGWKIPWTEESGRLQSVGSLKVRHDRATSLSLSTFMHWRRKWKPTQVLFPGKSHGQRSLVGYSIYHWVAKSRTLQTLSVVCYAPNDKRTISEIQCCHSHCLTTICVRMIKPS